MEREILLSQPDEANEREGKTSLHLHLVRPLTLTIARATPCDSQAYISLTGWLYATDALPFFIFLHSRRKKI